MDSDIVEMYRNREVKISDSTDITPLLQNSKVVISDTSSVVYEALLMDTPVLTLNSRNSDPEWGDFDNPDGLIEELNSLLSGMDNFKAGREKIKALYHPYSDGKSSERMVKAVENYINEFGVPDRRELPLLRKLKNIREFGLI
jgi:UDP-N-acetylglucosamine 2-epimerase